MRGWKCLHSSLANKNLIMSSHCDWNEWFRVGARRHESSWDEFFRYITRVDLNRAFQAVEAVEGRCIGDAFLQKIGPCLSELFEEELDLGSRRCLCEMWPCHWLF
jgi:hypothetical protein